MRRPILLCAAVLLAAGPCTPFVPFGPARAAAQAIPPAAPLPRALQADSVRAPWGADVAFLASLAVPGAGQYMLSQGRWVPYAAVETWAWIRYVERRGTARRLAEQYRDLAWSVARRVSTGERRDTTFPYYEVLTKSGASGAFDVQPLIPGIQPEQDPGTYNGEQWQLARALFIPAGMDAQPGTAAYAAALEYYARHAIPDAYAFAWTAGRLEQQVYTNVIAESDDAYSDAARLLGLILANHLTSSIDALISARLRRAGFDLRLESGFAPDARAAGPPEGHLRVPLLEVRLRYAW